MDGRFENATGPASSRFKPTFNLEGQAVWEAWDQFVDKTLKGKCMRVIDLILFTVLICKKREMTKTTVVGTRLRQ